MKNPFQKRTPAVSVTGNCQSKAFTLSELLVVIAIMDYLEGGMSPDLNAHYRSKGWNAAFGDGSVHFCKSIQAFNLVAAGQPAQYDNIALTNILTLLESGAK